MSRESSHAKTSLSKSIGQHSDVWTGSRNFPMVTINLFAFSKLFPPQSLQRDNKRPWEWKIRAIRARDSGKGEAKSVNQDVTSLDPITNDYILCEVSARLVVARYFYSNTTGFTNCFVTFSFSSYLSFLCFYLFPVLISYDNKEFLFSVRISSIS